MEPRWSQDGAKMSQDGAKMGQDGAKISQDGAKMNQDGTKMGQDGARLVEKRVRKDFRSIFVACAQTRNLDFDRPYGGFSCFSRIASSSRESACSFEEATKKHQKRPPLEPQNRAKIAPNRPSNPLSSDFGRLEASLKSKTESKWRLEASLKCQV